MQFSLPDIGDLLMAIALLFTVLIVFVGAWETRRANERERQLLNAIDEEYRLFCRLGRL